MFIKLRINVDDVADNRAAFVNEGILQHLPVMVKEVTAFLEPEQGDVVVDATIGCGGHARPILEKIRPAGHLIGIDRDQQAIGYARENLKEFKEFLSLANENFKDLGPVLEKLDIKKINGILFDLGVSSLQLDTRERGFSIKYDAPLDMRMDTRQKISAFELVNNLPQEELSRILKIYGEERHHARIARTIAQHRAKNPISTTRELAEIVIKAQPPHRFHRIHPATRTFQALRIEVNNELGSIEAALNGCVKFLSPGARICVLTYHSLEDRIAKRFIKGMEGEGVLRRLIKKPLRPSQGELAMNPRARSAKLRVAEKNGAI